MDKRGKERRQLDIVARKKLNYRFYNPNTMETTADYILKIFIEVNEKKVEKVMKKAIEQFKEEGVCEKL